MFELGVKMKTLPVNPFFLPHQVVVAVHGAGEIREIQNEPEPFAKSGEFCRLVVTMVPGTKVGTKCIGLTSRLAP